MQKSKTEVDHLTMILHDAMQLAIAIAKKKNQIIGLKCCLPEW